LKKLIVLHTYIHAYIYIFIYIYIHRVYRTPVCSTGVYVQTQNISACIHTRAYMNIYIPNPMLVYI
jgi:hypothetical protein